jgi:hypothetical protein
MYQVMRRTRYFNIQTMPNWIRCSLRYSPITQKLAAEAVQGAPIEHDAPTRHVSILTPLLPFAELDIPGREVPVRAHCGEKVNT